jgi:EAL domain-containing protein (putative c-di-GMP-specific phosphodiesterase class I)
MLVKQAEAKKLFWSEHLHDITTEVSKGEFWQRVMNFDTRHSHVNPPSIDSINHILTLIRDVQFDGAPAAVPIPLETTGGELIVVKFEIYLVIDNLVKGSVEVLSHTLSKIACTELLEHVLDDPARGVMITDDKHRVLFTNEKLCRDHGTSSLALLGRSISEGGLFHSDKRHIKAFQKRIEREVKWRGAMITNAKASRSMLEMVHIKRVEVAQERCFYIYSFLGEHRNPVKNNAPDAANIPNLEEMDEVAFRNSARRLSSQGGKFIVVSLHPRFYSELEVESRQKVYAALQSFHNADSFGYIGRNTFVVLLRIREDDVEDVTTINMCIKQFFTGLSKYLEDHLNNDISDGQIGVALHGFNQCAMDEVISQSVQAMFVHDTQASSVNFYDEVLVQASIRRRKLENLLIEAVQNKQIDVHFQPIVDTKTNQVVKLEALCRFQIEEVDYCVQEMIHLAEELKMINAIDMIVAEKAIKAFVQLDVAVEQKLTLSLNCSIADTESQHLQELFTYINESPVANDDVTIEITETSYFEKNINNSNLLEHIRDSGVKIAVDDFGTGNSSFSYFSDFHFDELKIDRKFITNIHQIKQKFFAVNMLRQLSHDLNIKVVAEGVENSEELETLKLIGVDFIQGYFFYRPMTAEQIQEHLTGSGSVD